MNAEEIKMLKRITPEEQAVLDGKKEVQRNIYTNQVQFLIEHEKLLDAEKLITVRKHTRFVHFPAHTHNYVEFFYVISGSITHIIEEKKITIYMGEMLFMNQYVQHEIMECGENDLAINFIIKPEFFEQVKQIVGENNILADFMMNILQQEGSFAQYLYFPVTNDHCIQNLMENIIYSITCTQYNMERICQTTVGLLFLHLLNSAEKVQLISEKENVNMLIMTVKQYIRDEYRTGTLQELASRIGYSQSALSRMIKKYTNLNFKEMQAKQRMKEALEMLCQTDLPISKIATEVGYENQNFFYKRFRQEYGMMPKQARKQMHISKME